MEDTELLAEVARLYFEEGLTQHEIAKQIHTSRSTVSRLLKDAKTQNIVEIRIHYPWDRSAQLEQQLREQFNLREVRVLEGRGRQGTEALRGTAILAARYLEGLLHRGAIVGMSWGRAVFNTVEMLKPLEKLPIKVVQLFGSAIPNSQIDGTDLVRRFAGIYGGDCYYIHAPLFVRGPKVKEELLGNPHIAETLELARQAKVILTGIGSLQSQLAPSQTWLRYLGRKEVEELRREGAVGHICAHHYDRQGRILNLPLHRGIVGVGPELLRQVPHVMGVACGVEKAAAILGALNGGLINTLITDDAAAREVLQLAAE